MDIALFSPSSLFHDDEDDTSSGFISFSLSLYLSKELPILADMAKIYWLGLALFAGEEDRESQQSYVERRHKFPGMVSLFLYLVNNQKRKFVFHWL